jgi:hypothetical protein
MRNSRNNPMKATSTEGILNKTYVAASTKTLDNTFDASLDKSNVSGNNISGNNFVLRP